MPSNHFTQPSPSSALSSLMRHTAPLLLAGCSAALGQTAPAGAVATGWHDCMCVNNGLAGAASFQVQIGQNNPGPLRTLQPRYREWHCLPVTDLAQAAPAFLVLLAPNPADPAQVARFRAPTVRTANRNCDTIGPRSQFTIKAAADGQRLTLEVREATPVAAAPPPVPADPDAEAWQRHRARITPAGIRTATHGEDAARICRHLMAERGAEIEAVRQRQPTGASPLQIERTRLHLLTRQLATLDLACQDQAEYSLRPALQARLERSLLACQVLTAGSAECEPALGW
jgi:hypothetical protein